MGTLLVFLALGGVSRSDTPLDAAEPGRTHILVTALGLHHTKGKVLVALFASEAGFPGDVENAVERGVALVESTTATFTFAPVPPGTYAISVFHDEDGDGKMKRGWFGQPKEGWGASHDAVGHFGPPSFEDAAFEALEDTVRVELTLRY